MILKSSNTSKFSHFPLEIEDKNPTLKSDLSSFLAKMILTVTTETAITTD